MAAQRRSFVASFLEIVRVTARDWVALALVGAGVPLLADDQRARLQRLPKRDSQQALSVLTAVAEAQKMANTNVTPSLVVDYLRMQLNP